MLVTELPPAPPITKDNLPPVCRSEPYEYMGETITRLTWTLFLFGVCTPFTAEFNRRSQTGTFSVGGKTVFHWSCEDPADSSDLPYVMTREGQKFILSWIVTDTKETFDLRVNNSSLNTLKYLDSAFQLTDDKVSLFKAKLSINELEVTDFRESRIFEYQPGVLTHKILEKLGDETPVTKIELTETDLETGVMNETISSLCQLNIPKTGGGLHTLVFGCFLPALKERLSETVLD